MAIDLEFLNFIVPISVIERKYPGGWQQCRTDYIGETGGPSRHDDQLFRLGAMDPLSMGLMVREWEEMGFQIERKVKGESRWNHGCIIGAGECAPTLPCAWLMVADDGMSARMKPGHPYETNLNKRS